jgi:hypothetical protein
MVNKNIKPYKINDPNSKSKTEEDKCQGSRYNSSLLMASLTIH